MSDLLQTAATPLRDLPDVSESELSARNRELNEEVTRLRLRVLELEGQADMDPLLPLYNRRAFIREVKRAQSVLDRYGLMSSIIFFDLDGFKGINDRYGHGVGDKLLERVAETLLSGVRQCDMVARLGGDEFGVLLFKSDAAVAQAKARVLTCRIGDQSLVHPDGRITIGSSWGVSPCELDQTPEQILDRADRAMYLCKRTNSRNSVEERSYVA